MYNTICKKKGLDFNSASLFGLQNNRVIVTVYALSLIEYVFGASFQFNIS